MLDTDALLRPTKDAHDQITALIIVINANTAALKDIRDDLTKCDTQEKAHELAAKIDKAIVDLSLDSQKIAPWIKAEPRNTQPSMGAVAYGQYPVDNPANPQNPVLAAEDMPLILDPDQPPWQPGDGKPPWAGGPGGPPADKQTGGKK